MTSGVETGRGSRSVQKNGLGGGDPDWGRRSGGQQEGGEGVASEVSGRERGTCPLRRAFRSNKKWSGFGMIDGGSEEKGKKN